MASGVFNGGGGKPGNLPCPLGMTIFYSYPNKCID